MEGLYKVIKNVISLEECTSISGIICAQPEKKGDTQVPNSAAYYGLPICNTLLGLLCSRISEISGKKLRPSYSYCRIYYKGAILKPHKDRPSCEYSVTLNLHQTHNWPIFMGDQAVDLQPGDGCLYKGCEIEHSRKKFEGDKYVQVFLHYVDSEGPYKNYVHDAETVKKHVNIYDFKKFNSHVSSLYNVNKVLDDLECSELYNLKIVPRTKYYEEIYNKIIQNVNLCNDQFFNFEISEIENLETVSSLEEHMDIGKDEHSRRKLTIIIQLSDENEYEGGDVRLCKKVTINKEKGNMTIFPSYMWYSISPATKGSAYFLIGWVTGPPFR